MWACWRGMCAVVVGAESMAVLYAVGAVVRRARAIGPSLSENSLAWLTDVGTSFAAQESALSTSSAEPLRSNWPVRSALHFTVWGVCGIGVASQVGVLAGEGRRGGRRGEWGRVLRRWLGGAPCPRHWGHGSLRVLGRG